METDSILKKLIFSLKYKQIIKNEIEGPNNQWKMLSIYENQDASLCRKMHKKSLLNALSYVC